MQRIKKVTTQLEQESSKDTAVDGGEWGLVMPNCSQRIKEGML